MMTPPTINISSKADLVQAYEALREAVVSCGASAAAPVEGRRLLSEGLLGWSRQYSACGAQPSGLNRDGGVAVPQGFHRASEQPQAAVVSVIATMALHAIDSLEVLT